MKALTALKVAFYLVIILGLVVFAVDLYVSRASWSFSLKEAPKVSVEPPGTLILEMDLNVHNPSHSKVFLRNLWFVIYVNGYFVGEGFKPYVVLNPGNNTVVIKTNIDLTRLPCPVAEALYNQEALSVNISGYVVADLMVFGKYSFRSVTVPFNINVENLEPPRLPSASRSLLNVYVYYCTHSDEIMKMLSRLSSLYSVIG